MIVLIKIFDEKFIAIKSDVRLGGPGGICHSDRILGGHKMANAPQEFSAKPKIWPKFIKN